MPKNKKHKCESLFHLPQFRMIYLATMMMLLLLSFVTPLFCFSPWAVRSISRSTGSTSLASSTLPNAAQLLEFQEPRTNVTVVLVGAMHYNPTSIKLAEETISGLGKRKQLGSVIVEACDIRWNKTAELYEEKPYLKNLLNNEMRTACDVAFSFDRPTVLGDQRINITTNALKASLKQTFSDLVNPPKGWKRFLEEVQGAWEETVPLGGQGYLSAIAFLDPRLLLVLPISLVKYPLSFLVRDPLPTSIVLSLLLALSYYDDPMTVQEMMNEGIPISDWIVTFLVSALETAIFARLLLKPLLAERNEILASTILEQCRIYSQRNERARGTPFGLFAKSESVSAVPNREVETVYAPGSPIAERSASGERRVVVAVLGMAHCNGIMKLLKEQKV